MQTNRDSSYKSGQNGAGRPVQSNGVEARPLTVDEALPYSPFASVIPFNPGLFPTFSIGARTSTSMFSNSSESEAVRGSLRDLNDQAKRHSEQKDTSKQLEQTLFELKEMLKPENLTQFHFKTSGKPPSSTQSADSSDPKLQLSPFAQMLFDQTDVDFRPLETQTGTTQVKNNKSVKVSSKSRSPVLAKETRILPPKHSNHVSNQQSHLQNSSVTMQSPLQGLNGQPHNTSNVAIPVKPRSFGFAVEVPSRLPPQYTASQYIPVSSKTSDTPNIIPIIDEQQPLASKPSPETPNPASSQFSIIMPQASSLIKTQQYAVYQEEAASPSSLQGKKRKRSELFEEYDLTEAPDQREKIDTALRNLQETMQRIFEAEGQAHLNDGAVDSEVFTVTGDGIISLASPALIRVEPLISRLIKLGKFTLVPTDELAQLQRLCDAALRATETVSIKIDESWGESDVDVWLHELSNAETGLRSARLSLQIMTGGRQEKQLYSEETVHGTLNAFKNVIDSCIIPITEMRPAGSTADLFKFLAAKKKSISTVLTQCRHVLSLLKDLLGNIDLSETVINTLEFSVSKLIFVENGHSEKESVLGVQKFDNLRVVAMDTLAQIFSKYPIQRRGIFDEILTSLEKLPVTKQSARQFKLEEGGSIQLVSALIMRLLQTSGNRSNESKGSSRQRALEIEDSQKDEDVDELAIKGHNHLNEPNGNEFVTNTETRAMENIETAINELSDLVTPLMDNAKGNASYVVTFIVDRAMRSTKTGDAPYRNLLDLFVQDFITCLSSTDWPAAELLLRVFLVKMVKLAESDKTPAPARNMALDVLAEMGAAISQLSSYVRKPVGSLESADTETVWGANVLRLVEASFHGKVSPEGIISWNGPLRVVLESLENRSASDDSLRGAIGYHLAEWATQVASSYENFDEEGSVSENDGQYGRLAYRLRRMICDKTWFSTEYQPRGLAASTARIAYSLTLLNSQFCASFDRILKILLDCMRSEQATVRSKSLKSVNQVLETDPSILDRFPGVLRVILECSGDSSIQVRDSALGLIGKCIGLKPSLEDEMISEILNRVSDTGIGVRKRAIKLLKDIYLRNEKRDVRSTIADVLLHRVVDLDEGVQELARTTIEEVWMHPFYVPVSAPDNVSAQYKLAVADQVSLMVRTVQRKSEVSGVLDKVLQSMLAGTARNAAANYRVCKTLVAAMFDTIIDNTEGGASHARDALQLLMIFAKANARLFTADQIQLLPPYIADLKKEDDLPKFRSVVVIFRHVFPQLSSVHRKFLEAVRETLMKNVSRVSRILLDDVMACLWIISTVLGNAGNLGKLAGSALANCSKFVNVDLSGPGQEEKIKKLAKLMTISSMCGKHCDLKSEVGSFNTFFPAWKDKDKSVSKLMVDTFVPFASPSRPMEVRKAALDAIGTVLPSWPKNFSSANVYTTFQQVFQERDPVLENTILRSFKEFLLQEEKRAEHGAEIAVGAGIETPATLGIMGGTQHDGVATEIAQKFLKDIIRIALGSQDEHAILATEILTSITRQGMTHPKECGPALVALETSQISSIADMAFREHRALHEKHETILEKEYMRAVHSAYMYQREIAKDTRGARMNPFASKLHLFMEVLKISKNKSRKRFFETLCARINFEPGKLDNIEDLIDQMDFSRFVVENMAFFDYQSVDELLITIGAMEKIVAGTGSTIAHAIETEIFQIKIEQIDQPNMEVDQVPIPSTETRVDPDRVKHLTSASIILSGIWETRTYLRRTYGLMTTKRESKSKSANKDLNRAPVKVPFITGDKYWEEMSKIMDSLENPESMWHQCKSFVELLNVDKDFKVAAEVDDDLNGPRNLTPTDDEGDSPNPPSGSGRGRKRKLSGTPSKKKRARSSSRDPGRPKKVKRMSVDSEEDAEGDWE